MEKSSKTFEQTIKAYLDKRAETDSLFAEKYRNEKKNIAECCKFIISEIHKMNVNGLSDDEVFGLAVHYYDEENVGKIDKVDCKVVVNHSVELTQEEKDQLKKEAQDKFISEQIANMKKPKVTKPAEKKESVELQLELF